MNYKKVWTEKYRPIKLSQVVGQDITLFKNIVITKTMPHLIIYGPAGVGKTSCILSLAYELYGPEHYDSSVLELNASSDRGIDVIREKILNFTKFKSSTSSPTFKMIICDESETMTNESMSALRIILEQSINTRFIFICNNIHKIIEPLKSRCVMIKFKPIKPIFCVEKLNNINMLENININIDIIENIVKLTKGDLRESILFLQNLKYISKIKKITIDVVNEIRNIMPYEIFVNYVNNIKTIDNIIQLSNEIYKKGYLVNSILDNCINYNLTLIDEQKKSENFLEISKIEKFINNGSDEHVIIMKMLSLFLHQS
jgi:DNA polymerase III delta prime subunit